MLSDQLAQEGAGGPLDTLASWLDQSSLYPPGTVVAIVQPLRLILLLYAASVALEMYSRYCLGLPVWNWGGGSEEKETGLATAGAGGNGSVEEAIVLDSGDLEFSTLPDALAAAEGAAKEFDFIAAGRALANADALAKLSDRNRYENAKW